MKKLVLASMLLLVGINSSWGTNLENIEGNHYVYVKSESQNCLWENTVNTSAGVVALYEERFPSHHSSIFLNAVGTNTGMEITGVLGKPGITYGGNCFSAGVKGRFENRSTRTYSDSIRSKVDPGFWCRGEREIGPRRITRVQIDGDKLIYIQGEARRMRSNRFYQTEKCVFRKF